MAFFDAFNRFLTTHPEALDLLHFLWTLKWWILFYLALYFVYLMEREHEEVWKPRLERIEKRRALLSSKGRLRI